MCLSFKLRVVRLSLFQIRLGLCQRLLHMLNILGFLDLFMVACQSLLGFAVKLLLVKVLAALKSGLKVLVKASKDYLFAS